MHVSTRMHYLYPLLDVEAGTRRGIPEPRSGPLGRRMEIQPSIQSKPQIGLQIDDRAAISKITVL